VAKKREKNLQSLLTEPSKSLLKHQTAKQGISKPGTEKKITGQEARQRGPKRSGKSRYREDRNGYGCHRLDTMEEGGKN